MTRQDDAGAADPDIAAIRSLLDAQTQVSGDSDPTAATPSRPEKWRAPRAVADASASAPVPEELDDDLRARIRAAQAEAVPVPTSGGVCVDDTGGAARGGRLLSLATPVMKRLRGYRPTRRHVAVAVLVALALWRPWLLVAMVVLPLLVVAGIFAAVGQDRFWAGALRGYRRLHARNPARAERLRARADRFALRWDSFLDRFPDGTVDALYLPDLNSLQEAQAQHAKALDRRFARLQQDARSQ